MMLLADFIQGDCQDIHRDHCNGVLQWESEIGLNSKDSKEKWGFVAREQDGDSC